MIHADNERILTLMSEYLTFTPLRHPTGGRNGPCRRL